MHTPEMLERGKTLPYNKTQLHHLIPPGVRASVSVPQRVG